MRLEFAYSPLVEGKELEASDVSKPAAPEQERNSQETVETVVEPNTST